MRHETLLSAPFARDTAPAMPWPARPRPARYALAAACLAGALFACAPPAIAGQVPGAYEVVASFESPLRNGARPSSALMEASDGTLWGTTSIGGAANAGVVYKITRGGVLTVVHHFNGANGAETRGGLVQTADGTIYGTTSRGGASNYGTIFRIAPDGTFATVHHFAGRDGVSPLGLTYGSDGVLYGTTAYGGEGYRHTSSWGPGTVFRFDGGVLTTMYSFLPAGSVVAPWTSEVQPASKLLEASDGSLYGTTYGVGSAVYRITKAGVLTTVTPPGYFGPNDLNPGELIQGQDGSIYGTVTGFRFGTPDWIFRIAPSGQVTTVYSWETSVFLKGVVQAADGRLFGTTQNTIFRIEPSGQPTTLHTFTGTDGGNVAAGLVQASDGAFYGTTAEGGAGRAGTIFRITPGGAFRVLLHSGTSDDGAFPTGVVEGAGGNWYGTTTNGGLGGGTVYRIRPNRQLTTLHRFTGRSFTDGGDGSSPGPLTPRVDGQFYGTTNFYGGGEGRGTLFRITPGGALTTVHDFTAAQEGNPLPGLLATSDGSFYGTTVNTIYRRDPWGGVATVYTFATEAGTIAWPQPLIEGRDGRVYGTTLYDGPSPGGGLPGPGTVFALHWSGSVSVLHTFSGPDGRAPFGRLTQGRDGRLYGTTSEGGAGYTSSFPAYGTVFAIHSSGELQTLHSFTGFDGASPYGGLVEAADGRFYGTTRRGGAYGHGTIYAIDREGRFTVVHNFSRTDGAAPDGWLALASDGSIWGTAPEGGPGDGGVVFRVQPIGQPLNVVPARIEAEDYDIGGWGVGYGDSTPGNEGGAYRQDHVDIKPTPEGGYAVGWFTAGEWLSYTINVPETGRYRIRARVGSALPDRTMWLSIDGQAVGELAVPDFGEWDRYGVVNGGAYRLTAGTHVITVTSGALGWADIDWLELEDAAAAAP